MYNSSFYRSFIGLGLLWSRNWFRETINIIILIKKTRLKSLVFFYFIKAIKAFNSSKVKSNPSNSSKLKYISGNYNSVVSSLFKAKAKSAFLLISILIPPSSLCITYPFSSFSAYSLAIIKTLSFTNSSSSLIALTNFKILYYVCKLNFLSFKLPCAAATIFAASFLLTNIFIPPKISYPVTKILSFK